MLIYVHLRSITRQVLSSLYLALSLSHINTRVSVRESESRASPALFAERGTSVELFYRIRAMGICIVARGSYRKKERLSIERSTTTTTKIQSRLCDCYASDTHIYTLAYIQAVSNFMQNSYTAARRWRRGEKKEPVVLPTPRRSIFAELALYVYFVRADTTNTTTTAVRARNRYIHTRKVNSRR